VAHSSAISSLKNHHRRRHHVVPSSPAEKAPVSEAPAPQQGNRFVPPQPTAVELNTEALQLFEALQKDHDKESHGYGAMSRFHQLNDQDWSGFHSAVGAFNSEAKKHTAPFRQIDADHISPANLVEMSEAERESAGPAPAPAAAKSDAKSDSKAADNNNPTYILPVDPYNYFPFFNGFSNVNPFSNFYPPPAYLYPQYMQSAHTMQNLGEVPPPYPINQMSNPYSYPSASAYPYGPYFNGVPSPSINVGTNAASSFPQFTQLSEQAKVGKHSVTWVHKSHSTSSGPTVFNSKTPKHVDPTALGLDGSCIDCKYKD
jgi:hypothetical protein